MIQNAATLPMAYAGNAPRPRGLRHTNALRNPLRERNDGKDRRDEDKLSNLDAHVEEERRYRDR
jgi:hypothetical protein